MPRHAARSKQNRWEKSSPTSSPRDEIKFVIGTVEDYDWAKQQIPRAKLGGDLSAAVFGWAQPLPPGQRDQSSSGASRADAGFTAETRRKKIIADACPVRFQGGNCTKSSGDGAAQGLKNEIRMSKSEKIRNQKSRNCPK